MTAESKQILLLTGVPGVGKTTVIRRVAQSLAPRRLRGFFTKEIRARGIRQGFRLTTFDGQEIVMAHVDLPKRYRVGRYGVDVAAIDKMVEKALRLGEVPDVYLVDEIGKMECLSANFVAALREILETNKPLIASVAQKGTGLIDEIKRRRDSELWQVTQTNRERLPEQVIAWLDRIPRSD